MKNLMVGVMGLLIGSLAFGSLEKIGVSFMKSRGIRNNNPGNIRLTRIDWDGKVPNNDNTDGEFEQFESPFFGIRAMARNLKSYRERGIDSIGQIVTTWAPANGIDNAGNKYQNDTEAYVNTIVSATGINPDRQLKESEMPAVIGAMIKHENGGQPYSAAMIKDGVAAGGWRTV